MNAAGFGVGALPWVSSWLDFDNGLASAVLNGM
jgi:hypothetical protein